MRFDRIQKAICEVTRNGGKLVDGHTSMEKNSSDFHIRVDDDRARCSQEWQDIVVLVHIYSLTEVASWRFGMWKCHCVGSHVTQK
jgi:hypothetical protein